jgi:putative phosphoserine phosphatase/1-acylglycerol-3-phosphate O-acyltransferase
MPRFFRSPARDTAMTQTAAFFRVEGTLTERTALAAAAWLASNAQGLGERFARLGNVALAAPLRMAGELQTGATATRMTWMGLRGMTEDRLVLLCEEYFEKYVKDEVLEVGAELVKLAKKQGRRVVLISDNIDLLVAPLAEQLGADDVVCNRLEMRKHKATGRLEDPVIGGNVAGQWARAFATEHGIDLGDSWAYGASAADSLLLSAIGQPCVVNPDRQLRRLAKDHDWPVVEK